MFVGHHWLVPVEAMSGVDHCPGEIKYFVAIETGFSYGHEKGSNFRLGIAIARNIHHDGLELRLREALTGQFCAHVFQRRGRLGVGNDPVYVKSRCFDTFPFPHASASARIEIRGIAEELDETRKQVLAEHPDITLTSLYNVLETVMAGAQLSRKELDIRNRGRVLILRELHDRLDVAVFKAYGWRGDIDTDQILNGLVRLNEVRAAEERRGFIKWLRPEYQIDKIGPLAHRGDRVQAILATKVKTKKAAFPTEGQEQARVVLDLIGRARSPLSAEEIAATFIASDRTIGEVRDVLQSLARLGQAESYDNGRSFFRAA